MIVVVTTISFQFDAMSEGRRPDIPLSFQPVEYSPNKGPRIAGGYTIVTVPDAFYAGVSALPQATIVIDWQNSEESFLDATAKQSLENVAEAYGTARTNVELQAALNKTRIEAVQYVDGLIRKW